MSDPRDELRQMLAVVDAAVKLILLVGFTFGVSLVVVVAMFWLILRSFG